MKDTFTESLQVSPQNADKFVRDGNYAGRKLSGVRSVFFLSISSSKNFSRSFKQLSLPQRLRSIYLRSHMNNNCQSSVRYGLQREILSCLKQCFFSKRNNVERNESVQYPQLAAVIVFKEELSQNYRHCPGTLERD